MRYYIEITLLPNADIGLYFLWQKVYQQIHLGLASMKGSNGKVSIGISFPEYDAERNLLGRKLRLFSQEKESLDSFNAIKCLDRLLDYIHVTDIKTVPEEVKDFAVFKRQQVKSSLPRIARRKAKREGIDFEEAMEALKQVEEKRVDTPFINIESLSSNKQFKLFITKHSTDTPVSGEFSCYGLSNGSTTVPWF